MKKIQNAFTLLHLYEMAEEKTLYHAGQEAQNIEPQCHFLLQIFPEPLAKIICFSKDELFPVSKSQLWKIMCGDSYQSREKKIQNYLAVHRQACHLSIKANWMKMLRECGDEVLPLVWSWYHSTIETAYQQTPMNQNTSFSAEKQGNYQALVCRSIIQNKWNEAKAEDLAELLTRLSLLAAACVITLPEQAEHLFPPNGQHQEAEPEQLEPAVTGLDYLCNSAFERLNGEDYDRAYHACLDLLQTRDTELTQNPQRRGDLLYLLYLCVTTKQSLRIPEWIGRSREELMAEAHACESPKLAERAKNLYHIARGLFYNEQEYAKCHQLCRSLWREYGRTLEQWGNERGDVLYLLERCNAKKKELKIPNYLPQNSRKLLELAAEYGSREAEELLNPPFAMKRLTRRTLLTAKAVEKAPFEQAALCVFNCVNRKAALFLESVPEDWSAVTKCVDYDEEHWERMEALGCQRTSKNLYQLIDPQYPRKFLLLSDNEHKNLHNTLEILEAIQEYRSMDTEARTEFRNIQIYVRGKFDVLGSQIDAMLNLVSTPVIRVYILDDEKDASRVLSTHPLFYSIRAKKQKERKKLHYVIIGGTETALWLAREAFWMMTFDDPNIQTAITVLAPKSARMEARFSSLCPGLSPDVKQFIWKHGSEDAPTFVETELEFSSLREKLKNCDDACYFSVAAGSDEENETLALWLREWTVRQAVSEAKEQKLKKLQDLPIITFLCRDPYMAYLSEKLVVQSEFYSRAWYANYDLIPFGVESERYTWEEMDGGAAEQQALCAHFQYAWVAPNEKGFSEEELRKLLDAEDEYYRLSYNRDSSLSVAHYLPYRLFQYVNQETGARILPEPWDKFDGSVFLSSLHRKQLADAVTSYLTTCGEKILLEHSKLEQLRWIRFLMSRGWMPASIKEMKGYIRHQTPRQQLYIAKLHPCLVPDHELDNVAAALQKANGSHKDFHSNNLRTVKLTAEILEAKWLKGLELEQTKQETEELPR